MALSLALIVAQVAQPAPAPAPVAAPVAAPQAPDAAPASEPGDPRRRDTGRLGPADGGEIVVTARRRAETVQTVPIAMSVIGGTTLADTGATQRPLTRQYTALVGAFGYAPPSTDAFDRLTDLDTSLQAKQELGGVSLVGNLDLGAATLTSVSAWRF